MPNDQMSLMQLAQMFAAQQGQPLSALGQQSPMADPNFAIQPQGRYMGNQWQPFNLDQMAIPFVGRPPRDANTYNPQDIMNMRGATNRQEDL